MAACAYNQTIPDTLAAPHDAEQRVGLIGKRMSTALHRVEVSVLANRTPDTSPKLNANAFVHS